MAEPLDVLRRDHVAVRPDPRFAVALRRRLEEELGMSLLDDTTTPTDVGDPVPSMVHIGVADPDRAMHFFGALLGWESERVDFEGHVRHYMINTERVQPVLVGEPGYPEVRLGFTVDDPVAARAQVEALGGTIEDVDPEEGRWFLGRDPAGTPLVLWRQGGDHPHRPPWAPARGELDYFQIDVPDASAVLDFYGELLGWPYEAGDDDPPGYHHVASHVGPLAMGIQGDAPEARVRLFFGVDDLAEAEERVRSLGGTVGERYEWGPMEAVPCTDDPGTRFVLEVLRPR